MIRFEVLIRGSWVAVAFGSLLSTGGLRWRNNDRSGYSPIGEWRLSDATINDPNFKAACRHKLSREEAELASTRQLAQAG